MNTGNRLKQLRISIHALTRRAAFFLDFQQALLAISIHALTRRAASYIK